MANLDSVVLLSNVRLSFPHIAEPQEQTGETGARITYNAEFIMPPDHPGWAKFWEVVNAGAQAKWKEKAPHVLQMIQGDRKKRSYGWGQEKVNQKTFKLYDGYEGMVFIGAARKQKDGMPQIIEAVTGTPIDPLNTMASQLVARTMYGGCYVNAAVKPWFQENQHGYGVRCELVAVQFLRDGEPFGEGHIDASGMFAPVPGAVAPGAPPSWGAAPGMPPGAPATAEPSWGAPQVPGMPAPPFQGVQGASIGTPPAAPAPGIPPFLR